MGKGGGPLRGKDNVQHTAEAREVFFVRLNLGGIIRAVATDPN